MGGLVQKQRKTALKKTLAEKGREERRPSLRGRQGQRRVSLKDRGELKILKGWGGNRTPRRGRDDNTKGRA